MSAKKLILALIDGLTPKMLEAAVGSPGTPTLTFLAENGSYARASSVFPSLTPVCVSSIVTGSYPDAHHIPHLVWYHRKERRLVEYGSSFGAIRRAGTRRSIRDAIFNMNREHLSSEVSTLFESLDDAGLTPAAVNIPCYRGRTVHHPTIPGVSRPAVGPKRFFYYSLFESDVTGAPLAVRNRARGTVDDYAAAAGRWLVTRDGFDFLAYYLSDVDYLSHAYGPDGTREAIERTDLALAALVQAAGGPDEFLERYAVVLCSDHAQTRVDEAVRLQEPLRDVEGVVVTASNRAGMVYRLDDCPLDVSELASIVGRHPAIEAVSFLEEEEAVVARDGEEVRLAPDGEGGWRIAGDGSLLDYPDACARIWTALQNPNAGELLVSPVTGVEFADLGGRHHAGGGSHGSLTAGDSEVPVLLVGVAGEPERIIDLAPLVLDHFELDSPLPADV